MSGAAAGGMRVAAADEPRPADTVDQIEKLSADLVEAYEALTLVYRTVSNLGGLFRMEDITAYLVNRALEAVEASSGALFLARGDAIFELSTERNGLAERLREDAARRLLQLGRPLFFHGDLAAEYSRPGGEPIAHLLSAPLETGGRTLGVLVLERAGEERFTTGDTKLVGALCGLTAVAVANFQHYRAVNYERGMLEGVIREIGDGIVVMGGRWRARLTNQAARALLGVADREPEGYDVLERLGTFQLSVPLAELRACQNQSREFIAESRDRRRPLVLAGKTFQARLGTDGEPIRVLCLRDVTRAHREEAAQRDFLSLASHKLRTPLTKILGLLPLARDRAADDALRGEAFRGIDGGAEELRSLVDGVLQFVEFRQGQRVVQPIVLARLVPEVIAAVKERRPARRIDVQVDVAPDTPVVHGSRQMLFTMLDRLVDNAVKFTPGGAAFVSVRIGPGEGRTARIVVEDRGEGIAPELLSRLFQPFSQRDEEFTGQAEGAGLGLMLVREVVERHGGKLAAESRLGAGTVFTAEIQTGSEGP